MKKVELRPAFVWTCDKCGRDHTALTITDDKENMDEVQQAVLAELDLPADAVDFLRIPSKVRCPDCDIWYRASPLSAMPIEDDLPESHYEDDEDG